MTALVRPTLRSLRRELSDLKPLSRVLAIYAPLFGSVVIAAWLLTIGLAVLVVGETEVLHVLPKQGTDCAGLGAELAPFDHNGRIEVRPAPDFEYISRGQRDNACAVELSKPPVLARVFGNKRPGDVVLEHIYEHGQVLGVRLVHPLPFAWIAWLLAGIVLLVFVVWRRFERPLIAPAAGIATSVRLSLLTFVAWAAIGWPVLTLAGWFVLVVLDTGIAQTMQPFISSPLLVLYFLLGAPLVEELLFRRMAYRLFYTHGYPLLGAFIVSGGFVGMHLQYLHLSWAQLTLVFLQLFALSLLCCWLYAKTRRLIAPLVLHALHNASAVGVSVWLLGP